MFVKLYNQKGEEVGKVELPKEIFEVPLNPDLVHQVVLVQQANRRRKIAKTKTRAEVRGGGRKPWRQKGTGRARAGSIRSPIWRGGGITFGPTTEKVFKKKIPKKMRRKALFMILSAKAKENFIFVLDKLEIEKAKTKKAAEILRSLAPPAKRGQAKKGSGLVVLPKIDKNLILSIRNIPKTETIQAKDLNVLDLLQYKYVIMPKESIEVIENTFTESAKRKTQNAKPQRKT